jgi:hypothetical protein
MSEKPDKAPKQTTPKGHEIPVPKKRDVLKDLDRLVRPMPAPPRK